MTVSRLQATVQVSRSIEYSSGTPNIARHSWAGDMSHANRPFAPPKPPAAPSLAARLIPQVPRDLPRT
jgi:hypothetical protein